MKRYIFILFVALINTAVFANANFDKTVNYQWNNAKVYEGETLYLIPITNSFYEKNVSEHYHYFMTYEFNDNYDSENNVMLQYMFNTNDKRDYSYNGTHKRHIEGHNFYVNKVVKLQDYTYTWVFYLTDLNNGKKLKFIYHGYFELPGSEFSTFPFIVEKHMNYCKSLIGQKLIFGTKPYNILINERGDYYYTTFETDIKTGEPISYTNVYVKWTIKDVAIDNYNNCLCFIVSNGKQITKVPYNIQYDFNHPKYNVGNRVFTEAQWNKLVNKYGETHMALIMDTKVSDDMTIEEKYMAGGKRLADGNKQYNYKQLIEDVGKTTFESTKSLISGFKEIGKELFK